MRTMLVFVLLCSLAPLAQSIDPKKVEGCYADEAHNFLYAPCFVPRKCVSRSFLGNDVVDLYHTNANDLQEDCGAIVKIHQYREYWMYFSIESFEQGINKIVLHFLSQDTKLKSSLTCERSGNNKVLGKYNYEERDTLDSNVIHRNEMLFPQDLPSSTNLICSFDVKFSSANKKIFKQEWHEVKMVLDTSETLTSDFWIPGVQCNPSNLVFENEYQQSTKVYAKVAFSAGKYYCNDDHLYKLEYRNEGSSLYEHAHKLDCLARDFGIDGEKIITDRIFIRCVADAQYFCKDIVRNVKKGDTKALEQVASDSTISKKGFLKCPDGYPHLFIENQLPITNPTFECLNLRGKPSWKVNNFFLSSEGPGVYCSATVNCHLLLRISADSIKKGYLDSDFLPTCYSGGVLLVGGEKVNDRRCDGKTGKFKYTISGTEKDVTNETKFECKYPISEEVMQKNAENRRFISNSVIVLIPSVLAIFIVVGVSACFIMNVRISNANKKMQAEIDAGYMYYSMTPNEKKAVRDRNLMPSNSEMKKGLNWNQMLMSMQYEGMKMISGANALMEKQAPVVLLPPLKDYQDKLTTKKWNGKKPKRFPSVNTPLFSYLVNTYDHGYRISANEHAAETNNQSKVKK